jgi:hypothetical protein
MTAMKSGPIAGETMNVDDANAMLAQWKRWAQEDVDG